jgi:hypothetical protein
MDKAYFSSLIPDVYLYVVAAFNFLSTLDVESADFTIGIFTDYSEDR